MIIPYPSHQHDSTDLIGGGSFDDGDLFDIGNDDGYNPDGGKSGGKTFLLMTITTSISISLSQSNT